MIGWHIRIGYITGYTCEADQAEAWELARRFARDIATSSDLWNEECDLFCERSMVLEVIKTYNLPQNAGNPLTISDDEIMITASGGSEWRAIKEHVARAFVRLLMERCHRNGFDISVTVA